MIANWKLLSSRFGLAVLVGLSLVLAACGGGRGNGEPTAGSTQDPIDVSVRQTLAAIAVAQTVAALTTPQVTAEIVPTPIVGATSTGVPTNAPPTTSPPTAVPPTTVPPTAVPPTAVPPTATATATRVNQPPVVENDAPGGSFPEDGSVTFKIIYDPTFLYRMDVRVLSVGDFEGAGIDSVGFSISGNGVNYFREERTAGFCVFGGGEPTCNPWPTNALGQYTWGVDGPVVESGEYFINMAVTADEPDDEFFGNWNWNFPFQVTVP